MKRMKRVLALAAAVFLLVGVTGFGMGEGESSWEAYREKGFGVYLSLKEKTEETLHDDTIALDDWMNTYLNELLLILPDEMPENVYYLDINEIIVYASGKYESASDKVKGEIDELTEEIFSRMDDETKERVEKAGSILDSIGQGLSDFSNGIFSNVSEEDVEELFDLGEAFAGKAGDILGDVFDGAADYALALFEKLPEDKKATVSDVYEAVQDALETLPDREELTAFSKALSLTETIACDTEGALLGVIVYDTGETTFPAVIVSEDGESVTLTAMYIDESFVESYYEIIERIN